MEVKLDQKLNEYKEYIDTLKQIDSLEVYNWLMGLGSKLNENPLSESKHLPENKVTKCQYDLYGGREDEKFKAWSKAMVAGGYAYILVDIFNSLSLEDAKRVTVDDFKKMKLDEMLTMNRQTGFYQMVEMMIKKLNNI